MLEALPKIRSIYGLYLRDGFPGVLLLLLIAATASSLWGPWDASLILEPGTTGLVFPAALLLAVLAPGLGLTVNLAGLVTLAWLFESRPVELLCGAVLGGKYSAGEWLALLYRIDWPEARAVDFADEEHARQQVFRLAEHWLRETSGDAWLDHERVLSASILCRTLAFLSFLAGMAVLFVGNWLVVGNWLAVIAFGASFTVLGLGSVAATRMARTSVIIRYVTMAQIASARGAHTSTSAAQG